MDEIDKECLPELPWPTSVSRPFLARFGSEPGAGGRRRRDRSRSGADGPARARPPGGLRPAGSAGRLRPGPERGRSGALAARHPPDDTDRGSSGERDPANQGSGNATSLAPPDDRAVWSVARPVRPSASHRRGRADSGRRRDRVCYSSSGRDRSTTRPEGGVGSPARARLLGRRPLLPSPEGPRRRRRRRRSKDRRAAATAEAANKAEVGVQGRLLVRRGDSGRRLELFSVREGHRVVLNDRIIAPGQWKDGKILLSRTAIRDVAAETWGLITRVLYDTAYHETSTDSSNPLPNSSRSGSVWTTSTTRLTKRWSVGRAEACGIRPRRPASSQGSCGATFETDGG